MPQTTDRRAARWPFWDAEAIIYLQSRGFVLQPNWHWRAPSYHILSPRDKDAILYLIEEWDFGYVGGYDLIDPPYTEEDFDNAYLEQVCKDV